MSLNRRVQKLEQSLPHMVETLIVQWDIPGPLTSLEVGDSIWQRGADEDEETFIDRVQTAAGNVRFLWGMSVDVAGLTP